MTTIPPYASERGEHKKPVQVHNFFGSFINADQPDVVLACVRHNMDCSKLLLEEGLILIWKHLIGTGQWTSLSRIT